MSSQGRRLRVAPRVRAGAAAVVLTTAGVAALASGAVAAPVHVVETPVPSGVAPHSIAVSHSAFADGSVFYTDPAGGTLQERTAGGRFQTAAQFGAKSAPRGVAADQDTVWVAGFGDDTLYKVSLSSSNPTVESLNLHDIPGMPSKAVNPQGVLVSEDHSTVWVSLTSVDRLVRVDTSKPFDADAVTDLVSMGSTQSAPTFMTEGADGRVWVAEQSTQRHGVAAIDPANGDEVAHYPVPSGDAILLDVAATEDGIITADYRNSVVYAVGLDGTVGDSPAKLPEGTKPRAISVGMNTAGGATSAWVVGEGTATVSRIDLDSFTVTDQIALQDKSVPYALTYDAASASYWGTEFAGKQIYNFTQQDVISDQLTITAGDGGWALPGAPFSPRLAVTATTNENPSVGAQVTFTVDGDAASFVEDSTTTSTITVETDANGVATIDRDLIAASGITTTTPFQVTASTPGAAPVTFNETVGVTASTFEAVSPVKAYAHQNRTFQEVPATRVATDSDTALPGTPVTFAITDPGVSFVDQTSPVTVLADHNGVATAPRVTAGDQLTAAHIVATTPAKPNASVDFTYTITPPVDSMELTGDDTGIMYPGSSGRLDLHAYDENRAPVPGEQIYAVIDPPTDGVSLGNDGSTTLTLTTNENGIIEWGGKGDGSDTWNIGPGVSVGTEFNVVFHTADGDGVTITRHVQVASGLR